MSFEIPVLIKQLAALFALIQNLVAANPNLPHDAITRQERFVEVTRAVLKCYHPSGHYGRSTVVARPWKGAGRYRADQSLLIEIRWQSPTAGDRDLQVALLRRKDLIRGVVVESSAAVRPQPKCALRRWTPSR